MGNLAWPPSTLISTWSIPAKNSSPMPFTSRRSCRQETRLYQAARRPGRGNIEKIHMLFKEAGFTDVIHERDLTAVKCHFGERGCTSFVSPALLRPVVADIIEQGA